MVWNKVEYYALLYLMYMDSLSTSLNSTNIEWHIGGKFLYNVCYADDLCLISMSSAGMQRLLNICKGYAEQHWLHYNGSTPFSMCFKSKSNQIWTTRFVFRRFKDSPGQWM